MSRLNDTAAAMNGEPEPIVPAFQTAREIMVEFPEMREPLIDGMLRRGEVMNFIAAPKVGKSFLMNMLGISVAGGRTFLNRFPVRRGRVLVLDNELHPNTVAKRIKTVADAMGLMPGEYADNLCVECFRGKSATIDRLVDYAKSIGPDRFDLVVIDAWYRAIPKGFAENENSDMTQLYNMVDTIAATLNAGIVLIHHASKGDQSGKAVTDVGAGAGAQTRAADAHFIIRQHEQDDAVVVDAVARSFPPPEPFCMRWAFPTWTVDDTLDPTQLRRTNKRRDAAAAAPPKPEPEPWTVERWIASFFSDEPRVKKTIFARARLDPTLTGREADALHDVAVADGLVFEWQDTSTPPRTVCATRQPDLVDVATPIAPPVKRGRGRPRKHVEPAVMEVEDAA